METEVIASDIIPGADTGTVPVPCQTSTSWPGGRRVSPSEARKIALDSLYRAEARRRQTAVEEAKHGIPWELL
jgi:hypothetical protein